jgi:flagellar basal body-associated protein FliL
MPFANIQYPIFTALFSINIEICQFLIVVAILVASGVAVLCFWHVSKDVTVNCKGRFGTAERFEEFLKPFKDVHVVYAKTDEQFQDLLDE